MKRYKIEITEHVRLQIQENYQYIIVAWDNLTAANKHTNEIHRAFHLLETMPRQFAPYLERDGIEYRMGHVLHYRFVYHVDDVLGIVYIDDLLHSRRNPADLLADGD